MAIPVRGAAGTVVALVVALGLSGCATSSGGVPGELARAAAGAASAAASGALAVELLEQRRTSPTVTDITLITMLAESQDAEVAAATLVVEDAAQTAERDAVLAAVHAVTQQLAAARAWTSQGASDASTGRSTARALRSAARTLSDLEEKLGGGP